MRYLGLALFAEGRTDYYFLLPLLQRLCEEVCVRDALTPVEVSSVLGLDDPDRDDRMSRAERIATSAQSARGAWDILFVHADGANDPQRAREQQVQPSLDLIRDIMGGNDAHGVGVVPVRETEAWMIADGDALRSTFGTKLSDLELGLPPRNSVESIADPKSTLLNAFAMTNPSNRRARQGVSPYLNILGEQISLDVLRSLPSFQCLESELRTALRSLAYLS